MKIGIIGAGITGLSAAYFLRKRYPEAKISLIERSGQAGGLGSWIDFENFSIEPFYHHFFESDKYIKVLAKELNIDDKLFFKKAKSAYFYDDGIFSLSGPLDLLMFPRLSIVERLRVITSMIYLKLLPSGSDLDKYSVEEWMHMWIGKNAYSILWEPLMKGKFENHAKSISMAWMWGRIHDRTIKLGYFIGGIKVFFKALESWLMNNNIEINYNTSVIEIEKNQNSFEVKTDKNTYIFDKLIFTTTSPVFSRLTSKIFRDEYLNRLKQIHHIGTVCLIFILNRKLQNNYWLNMCSLKTPYLITVEHTNFLDSTYYNNKHVIYMAKYADPQDEFYKKDNDYYFKEAMNTFKLLDKNFSENNIEDYRISKVPASQTLFPKGYAALKPEMVTPNKNVFLVNIDQTFPHDRNLNMGIQLARDLMQLL